MTLLIRHRNLVRWGCAALLLACAVWLLASRLEVGTLDRLVPASPAGTSPGALKVPPGMEELPRESDFRIVGENDRFRLKLDAGTAHFLVEDVKDGRIWRSYPDPAHWPRETVGGVWRTHLRSPVMLQYIDLNNGNKAQPKETNLLEEQGSIKDIEIFPGGFRLVFDMPSKQMVIPIEVKLEGDSVVTRILDEGLREQDLSLLWIRLYPFFGAERSEGQEGYLFIPDGPGALIPFDPSSSNRKHIYREPVFGTDLAYSVNKEGSFRQRVILPVYGSKHGSRSFLAVLEEGAEQADILASPSGVFSTYNWITAQANYRMTYRQVTNKEKERSFMTYNKEGRFGGDRATRYFLLDSGQSDYAGMAGRYRRYLMETYGLKKLTPRSASVPMDVIVAGGDTADAMIGEQYIRTATTSQASQMIMRLHELGMENMTVRYWGWQKDGFGADGTRHAVDKRLGGDQGMKDFVKLAHSLNIPVYLSTNYLFNSTGGAGFHERIHGMRDRGGSPLENMASHAFAMNSLQDEVRYYKSLGVDGLEIRGIGQQLNSDYNSRYGASRGENRVMQQTMVRLLREGIGKVIGYRSNFYLAPLTDGVANMVQEHSDDLFTQTGIPFAQIALHGLIPYSSKPTNERDEFREGFLRNLEFGANPSFFFTHEVNQEMKYARHLFFLNTAYRDWEETALQEYRALSEALGSVQDQFITGHRILADKVRETVYENGRRIVVNYDTVPYRYGNRTVEPEGYLVVEGREAP